MGGNETRRLLPHTLEFCQGLGVDFGCEIDPHPNAAVLVDGDAVVWERYHATHEVHIRDINAGFPDWPDARFDWAYSSHVIEHLRDPWAFLAECWRLLRPGGTLLVAGPHEDWYWPNGHPDANPDHTPFNWALNQDRVAKWVVAVCPGAQVLKSGELGRPANWSFLVVARKPLAVPDALAPRSESELWESLETPLAAAVAEKTARAAAAKK